MAIKASYVIDIKLLWKSVPKCVSVIFPITYFHASVVNLFEELVFIGWLELSQSVLLLYLFSCVISLTVFLVLFKWCTFFSFWLKSRFWGVIYKAFETLSELFASRHSDSLCDDVYILWLFCLFPPKIFLSNLLQIIFT